MPEFGVIIISFNTRDLLDRCLESVIAAASAEGAGEPELVVVDNGSSDGSREMIRMRYPQVKLLCNDTNHGFAAANNEGLAAICARSLLLLNSDAFLNGPALSRGLELLRSRSRIGLVGIRLANADGTTQAEWGHFPSLLGDLAASLGFDRALSRLARSGARQAGWSGPVDWVQGACMFVRREALDEVGGLDEAFFMYSEEVDWCRRFWLRGWDVWYAGDVAVTHLGGASSTDDDLGRRGALYKSRLGLRRRLGGPSASLLLWLGMVVGLGGRAASRAAAERLAGRRLGRHTAKADWQLTCAVARLDPLAGWAVNSR